MGLPLARAAERYNHFCTICSRALSWQDHTPQDDSFGAVEVFVCFQTHLKWIAPPPASPSPHTSASSPTPPPTSHRKGASWTVINPSSQGTGLLLTSVSQECGKLQLAAAGAGASGSGAGEGAGAELPAKRRKLDASAYPRG